MRVYDRIAQQSSNDTSHAIHAVVCNEPQRLLVMFVPHGHDQHKSRIDDCLCNTQQKPIDSNAGEIVACWRCDDEYAPGQDSSTDKFPNFQTLEKVPSWILSGKIACVVSLSTPLLSTASTPMLLTEIEYTTTSQSQCDEAETAPKRDVPAQPRVILTM